MPCLAVVALLMTLPAEAPAAPEWLTDQDGVLELMLAHREDDRVDGGTLRLDRRKRLVTWTGAPGEIGCQRAFEAAFSDVKKVEEERGLPGFRLELRTGKPKAWTLMPLPHVEWLLKQPGTKGGLQRIMDEGGMTGPDGGALRVGGDAGASAPVLRKADLPEAVERDIRQAIETLRAALAHSGE
jgi:hypothetical protein